MQTINHKEEVLKVYPDAEIMVTTYCSLIGIVSDIALDKYDLWELGSADTENDAWQNAYNNIKNQNQ